MSCKKYILKKDMRTFVIRDKLPVMANSPIRKIRPHMLNPSLFCPVFKKRDHVAKSLQTLNRLKKNKTKSLIRKKLDLSLQNSFPNQLIHSNLRYLFQNFDDEEDENQLKTPNDSLKVTEDLLKETINLDYQRYLEAKNEGYSKFRNLTPQWNLGTRIEKNDVESPRDVGCFWKKKRIF